MQGTVLLHFNFAIKQDQRLAKTLLSEFGSSSSGGLGVGVGSSLSPFRIGMLLSMHQIQRFSAPAIQAVVKTTKREYEAEDRASKSEWIGVMVEQSKRRKQKRLQAMKLQKKKHLQKKKKEKKQEKKKQTNATNATNKRSRNEGDNDDVDQQQEEQEQEEEEEEEGDGKSMEIDSSSSDDDDDDDANEKDSQEESTSSSSSSTLTSCSRALHSVINNTSIGWENIIPSALRVCIALIETKANTFGRPTLSMNSNDSLGPPSSSNGNDTTSILENPLVLTRPSPEARCNTLGIELLSAAFVRQAAVRPQVLDAASMALAIRAPSTDNFILLLGKICQQTPSLVLQYERSLKETLEAMPFLQAHQAAALMRALQPVLAMRRSLLDATVVVLRKSTFSRDSSSRKVAVSGFLQLLGLKHTNNSNNSNGNNGSKQLYFDALGSLRRCLSQDETVRRNVYEGGVAICAENSTARPYVLELLSRQLMRFVNINETPPILLDECVKRHEPIGYLIMSLHRCAWEERLRREEPSDSQSSRGSHEAGEGQGEGNHSSSSSSSTSTSSSSITSSFSGSAQSARVNDILLAMVKNIGVTHPEDYDLESDTDYSGETETSLRARRSAVSLLRAVDALCNTIEDEVLEYEDASVPVYGETALGRIISITQSMDVQSFCCGGEHAAILTTSGSIFTWGKSSFGRLGHGAPTLQRQNNHPGHVGRPKNER